MIELTILGIVLIIIALAALWVTVRYSKPADLSFLDPMIPKDYPEEDK